MQDLFVLLLGLFSGSALSVRVGTSSLSRNIGVLTCMCSVREQKCGRDIRTTQEPHLVVLSRFLSGSGVLASTFVFQNSHKKNKHGHIAGVLIA